MMEHIELSQRLFFNAAKPLYKSAHPQALGSVIAKRPNHVQTSMPRSVTRQAYNARHGDRPGTAQPVDSGDGLLHLGAVFQETAPTVNVRELAVRFTDSEGYFVSEASVYRLLKARDLIASPAFIVMKAADDFTDKTTAPNQFWQTDFTYRAPRLGSSGVYNALRKEDLKNVLPQPEFPP